MRHAALLVLAGGAAAVVSARAAGQLARSSPLRRRNYRGVDVAVGPAVGVALGVLAGAAVVSLLHLLMPESARLGGAAAAAPGVVAAMAGFGLLGAWDDRAGDTDRGWRAHLRALRHGRTTGGAIKLLGGGCFALILTAARGESLGWTLVAGVVLALSANLWNLFDVAPGRACKWFVVALLPMLVAGASVNVSLAAALGAALAFLPLDLRERAMLGDAGANALGAIVGWGIVVTASHAALLVALALLVVTHAIGDEPGLTRVIEAVRPLRAFDRAGRAPT